jgi:dGTPase
VYRSKEVLNKEIAGFEILNQLLNAFGSLAYNYYSDNLSYYDELLLNLLPEAVHLSTNALYDNLLAICLYISKLSDTNALLLHQKLKGHIL